MTYLRSLLFALCAAIFLGASGCGNAEIFFSVNTGTILTNPACLLGVGRFRMLDQTGLVMVVVITDTTNIIVAGGASGSCDDLNLGNAVEVSGWVDGDTVTAETISVV